MRLPKLLLLVGVGTLSAGVGVAIPLVLNGGTKSAAEAPSTSEAAATDDHDKKGSASGDSHGKDDAKAKADGKKADKKGDAAAKAGADSGAKDKAKLDGPQFVPFGRMVVNLNEPALTKYLSLEITLLTDPKDASTVASAVETRMPILRTWLTGHLADKSMEDVRGKVGVNRLRREIQDQFNALLFEDGQERVRDVLFEEFHIE